MVRAGFCMFTQCDPIIVKYIPDNEELHYKKGMLALTRLNGPLGSD